MIIKNPRFRIVLAFMALFLIQFAVLIPASADLTEVETNKQGLSKTEPTDASGGEPVDGEDGSLPWWKKALNELGDIGDSLVDGWNKFKDWAVDEWNDAWDIATDVWGNIEDFFKSIGDWFSENEWAQTLLGGILAAGIIIGVIALLVFFGVIAIPLGIVAGLIIVAGALIGGFTYQWLAGDNYSFWGAFSFALVGGVLGYIGYATGAFAAAIGWIRTVAWPAAANWWRTAAWPWLRGRPAAIWGWMKGPAWNWLKGRGVALKGWFTGRAVPWAQGLGRTYLTNLLNFYRTNGLLKGLFLGPGVGAIGGFASAMVSWRLTGQISPKSFFTDIGLGALSGGLVGPLVAAGRLGWKTVLGLSIYGGAEGYLADGIKEGAWKNFENFLWSFGMSAFSSTTIKLVVERIKNEVLGEVLGKSAEEYIKTKVKDAVSGGEGGDVTNHEEKKTELKPKEAPESNLDVNNQNNIDEGSSGGSTETSNNPQENSLEENADSSKDINQGNNKRLHNLKPEPKLN